MTLAVRSCGGTTICTKGSVSLTRTNNRQLVANDRLGYKFTGVAASAGRTVCTTVAPSSGAICFCSCCTCVS